MDKILKGKAVSDKMKEKMLKEVKKLEKKEIVPTLGIIRVGDNPDDIAYEKTIEKQAENLGIEVVKTVFYDNVPEKNLIREIESYNEDETIHGIMLFRPLPARFDEDKIRNLVLPEKDIDGITDESLSMVFAGKKGGFAPCTAQATIEILKHYQLDIKGKNVAILGRSLVVGKPLAMMILGKNGTPIICHSKTKNLKELTQSADIVICAMGKGKMVDDTYFSGNQIVIDVGINVDEQGNLCGDVDFDKVLEQVSAITPVPGGVGGVTTSVLLSNVVSNAVKEMKKELYK